MDPAVLRILDAALNRAAEGLRVTEDYARFALDDADASAALKTLRHALRQAAATIDPARRLNARDVLADVGRDATTHAELHRADLDDVVGAAFARLHESLRSLAEYGKLVSVDFAVRVERLRYESYEVEQRVRRRGDRRRRFRHAALYVIVTQALCRGDWLETAAHALRGGARCLQLREKSLPDAELLRRARALRRLTADHDALLVVNDRPDIARLAAADGVHLGQDDLSVRDARSIAGGAMLVGKSTHNPDQIAAAIAEQPDYIAVGPMFASSTKPQAHVAGPQTLARATEGRTVPIVAIGGILDVNIAEIVSAGAQVVCVCSAVISQPDPCQAARNLLAAIAHARSTPPADATPHPPTNTPDS